MPSFTRGSLNSRSSRLRRSSRNDLLEQLTQQANPLGAFLDPTLRQSATNARAGNLATTGAARAGAAADAVRRLGSIEDSRTVYPGRTPGGTGLTGVSDRRGYTELLGEQREFADLLAALHGREAPITQVAPNAISGGEAAPAGPALPTNLGINSALADIETGGARDVRTLQNIRRADAGTRTAEAGADLAELQADPLAQAKTLSGVRRFDNRSGVDPVFGPSDAVAPELAGQPGTIPGVERIGFESGGQTELAQQADRYRDPNFPTVLRGAEAESAAGVGGLGSPGERIARINQQTSFAREANRAGIAEATNAARLAIEQARQRGMDERASMQVGMRAFEAVVRGQIAQLSSAADVDRLNTGIEIGPFGGGVSPEITLRVQDLENTLNQLQGVFGSALPGADAGAGAGNDQGIDPSLGTEAAPPEVQSLLDAEPPGSEVELSDGSVWRVGAGGQHTRIK